MVAQGVSEVSARYVRIRCSRGPVGFSAISILGCINCAATAKTNEGGCKWQDFKER